MNTVNFAEIYMPNLEEGDGSRNLHAENMARGNLAYREWQQMVVDHPELTDIQKCGLRLAPFYSYSQDEMLDKSRELIAKLEAIDTRLKVPGELILSYYNPPSVGSRQTYQISKLDGAGLEVRFNSPKPKFVFQTADGKGGFEAELLSSTFTEPDQIRPTTLDHHIKLERTRVNTHEYDSLIIGRDTIEAYIQYLFQARNREGLLPDPAIEKVWLTAKQIGIDLEVESPVIKEWCAIRRTAIVQELGRDAFQLARGLIDDKIPIGPHEISLSEEVSRFGVTADMIDAAVGDFNLKSYDSVERNRHRLKIVDDGKKLIFEDSRSYKAND